jgi:hypothetical protein
MAEIMELTATCDPIQVDCLFVGCPGCGFVHYLAGVRHWYKDGEAITEAEYNTEIAQLEKTNELR